MSTHEHKKCAPASVRVAVLTVSTTRTLEQDQSGAWIAGELSNLGHQVAAHQVVTDQLEAIREALSAIMDQARPQVILVNGGTGVAPSDVTIEAVRPLLDKELTAFGALFAALSFEEIGSAALMSRAVAGVWGDRVVFCMPGSLGACRLACSRLIFPELGHMVKHLRHDP